MSRFLINEEEPQGFVLPASERLAPPSENCHSSEVDDPYDFEDYEYDLPPEGGFFRAVLLFPFALVVSLLELLWDVLRVVPYLIGELIVQLKDAGFAIFYFTSRFVHLVLRFFVSPIVAIVTDPIGFLCYQADRVRYVLWTVAWYARLLWSDLWEQLDDVGRLIELGWWHVLNAFGLTQAELPPVHAVPLSEAAGLARASRIQFRVRPSMTSDAAASRTNNKPSIDDHQKQMAERRRGFRAVTRKSLSPAIGNNSSTEERQRPRFQIRPIDTASDATAKPPVPAYPEFKVSLRTRLADEVEGAGEVSPASDTPSESWYRLYCCTCPSCLSDEVYPTHSNGMFAESLSDRAWLIQNMYCERCLSRFKRPGRLFLAPAPLIRPLDTEMYD